MKLPFVKLMDTVRWRLTAWYTLVLLATFGVFALAVHGLVSGTLYEQVDQDLQGTMSTVGASLDRVYREEKDLTPEHYQEEMEELNLPSDTSFAVRAPSMPDYERRAGSDSFLLHLTGVGHDREFAFGLGLAIVKTIIELHGRSVEARNHPGKGATFLLHIPQQSRV